jgi:hypothetical protein
LTRILRPDDLSRILGTTDRRLQKLERAPLLLSGGSLSTPGDSVQNQAVPPSGNFDGSTKYDLAVATPCKFTLSAPAIVMWLSYATLKLTAPVGGNFGYLTTAVSLSPWNPALVIFESGSQLFDKANPGYVQSSQWFWIGPWQTEGALGPGAAPLGITMNQGPLPAGTYEVRQRMLGDAGLLAQYYQGSIQVWAPGA